MNVGLVGAGNISDTHARAALAAGLRIEGIHGDNRDKARTLADRHGTTAFDSLDALLAQPSLDLVIIGSPSGRHAEQAIAAARRGRHVLIEKPLDITTARIDALAQEVERAKITLGVIFQDRLKPDVVEMKRRLDAGELGTPLVATAEVKWSRPPEYYSASRWRGTWALDGGGALMNQGIHTVDLLLWLCGPVARVYGRTSTACHDIEVEDTAVALLEFASGALGTLTATTCAYPGRPRRIEIVGSKGTAVLEGDLLSGQDGQVGRVGQVRQVGQDARQASPVVSDVSAHQAVFEDFIRACATGTPPNCGGDEGRRSVQLIEAIYQSSRLARPVDVIQRT